MGAAPGGDAPAATRSWQLWGLEACVTVAEPGRAGAAEDIVRAVTCAVDAACSRFRPDSELAFLQPRLAAGASVSPLLALLVEGALDAARRSDGAVDPTLGATMAALGYDRDLDQIRLRPERGGTPADMPRRGLSWRDVRLEDGILSVPEPLRLDLGATAKAAAADMAVEQVFELLGCGVLVSLGGDLATKGPAPAGGWQVLVQDLPADPSQQVTLRAGSAMATSSTQKRRWHHNGQSLHHILDPRFGLPAPAVWRSVTVAADSCVLANTFSTSGVIDGHAAVKRFRRAGVAARLVDRQGRVVTTGGWPEADDAGPPTSADAHAQGCGARG